MKALGKALKKRLRRNDESRERRDGTIDEAVLAFYVTPIPAFPLNGEGVMQRSP